MKEKALNVVGIVAAIVAMVSSMIYLFTQKMIPGLSPLALAVLMGILLWNYKKKNKTQTIKNYKIVSILFLVACVLNFVSGIIQIVSSLIK
ncbi:MAG: hypothetical protein WAX04_01135 [Oscillospiraceae bacterium]